MVSSIEIEEKLAKVSGVVIPSKLPPGKTPLKAQKTRPAKPGLERLRIMKCPICSYTASRAREIRSHFLACVEANGNPTGARWDDTFNFVPRPYRARRKTMNNQEEK